MADWKVVAEGGGTGNLFGSVGNGLLIALGVLTANITSGLTFVSGQIAVKNGSGIAFDGSGNLTVNAGVGLTLSGGFLTVGTGTGLSTSGGTVYIPGGAITNALLAALSVATANIQSGAVTATQIASATITTANIGAAQITTALIANAAITNALLGSAVVGTANIQNAAITTALVANAAIGSAQISTLSASQISAGTISAAVSMTSPNITSTSGAQTAQLFNGELLCIDSGAGTTTQVVGAHVNVSSSGYQSSLSQNSLFCGDAALNNVGFVGYTELYLKISGSKVFDVTSSAVNSTVPVQIGGTTVIDASRNGSFAGLTAGGKAVATVSMTPASGTPVLNYGGGGIQVWTSDLVGSGGTFGTYSNKIPLYNNAGTFVGYMPII